MSWTAQEAIEIIDAIIRQKGHAPLTDIRAEVFMRCWEGESYSAVAKNMGYDPDYIKQVGHRLWLFLSEVLGIRVEKRNLQSVLRQYSQIHAIDRSPLQPEYPPTLSPPNDAPPVQPPENLPIVNIQDWGRAIDVSLFYGRDADLKTLQQWVAHDRCRLLLLLGMGGIGKTALSVQLARQLQSQFEFVIWRSLRNAPPLAELLRDILPILLRQRVSPMSLPEEQPWSGETLTQSPLQKKLAILQECLKTSRCLLILDNAESILQTGDRSGFYREDYRVYEDLFWQISTIEHQSCLLITSREKPHQFDNLESSNADTRSLLLRGLTIDAGEQLLANHHLVGSTLERQQIWAIYQGNPLSLQIVANYIREVFAGQIATFLEQGLTLCASIQDVLQQQFERLPESEQAVMYWLAIHRETVTIKELQRDLITSPSLLKQVPTTLQSLGRRSLVERSSTGFTQQPVVMEYVTEKLVQQIVAEILDEQRWQPLTDGGGSMSLANLYSPQSSMLKKYALLKADARDYIRVSQERLILKPVLEHLLHYLGTERNLVRRFQQVLAWQQTYFPLDTGYLAGNLLNLLCCQGVDLTGWNFSDLTIRQAYLQNANLHQVNLRNSDVSQSVFIQTFGQILAVAFSPDGQYLATGDVQGCLCLRRVADQTLVFFQEEHASRIFAVSFSPDSQYLATGSSDQTIRIWSVATGECLRVLEGHEGDIFSVAFDADGQLLASAGMDATIRIWHVPTGRLHQALQSHAAMTMAVAFSPNGQFLAAGNADQSIQLLNTKNNQCQMLLTGHDDRITSLAFSPDSQVLASGSEDSTLRLWQVNTGQCLQVCRGHAKSVLSVSFLPHGQRVASSSADHLVKLWDVATGQCVHTFQGHGDWVWSISISPDGNMLASGSDDLTVRLWDLHSGQCLQTLRGYTNVIWSVQFNPIVPHLLAGGSSDHAVRLWHSETQQCQKTLTGHQNIVWSVAFSPDGQWLASGSIDTRIKIWSVSTGSCVHNLLGHTQWVWSVAFSPDGQWLASGSADKTIKLWDINTGRCLRTLRDHTDWVWPVCFAPRGTETFPLLASGSNDQTIRLWNANTGQCLHTLTGHENWVRAVAFSPDGRILASGGVDRTIRLWDVPTGQCLAVLEGHQSQVWSVAFNADASLLASSSHDRTIRLWDLTTEKCLRVLTGHTRPVRSVAFDPDGQTLASSSEDQTIRLWQVSTGQYLRSLRAPRPYEGMQIQGIKGISEAIEQNLRTLGAVD